MYFPHSLGIFYQALTQYLGFPYYGDEYKVMGLAAYGSPSYMPAMHKIVKLTKDGAFAIDLTYFGIIGSVLPTLGTPARPNSAICFLRRLRTC
jgi:predicted NodU family carbamoyl transferase